MRMDLGSEGRCNPLPLSGERVCRQLSVPSNVYAYRYSVHLLGGVSMYCDIRRLLMILILYKSSSDKIDKAMDSKFKRKDPRESSCSGRITLCGGRYIDLAA